MGHTVRIETTKRYTFTEAEFKKRLGIEGEGELCVMAFPPGLHESEPLGFTNVFGTVRFTLTTVSEGAEIETP